MPTPPDMSHDPTRNSRTQNYGNRPPSVWVAFKWQEPSTDLAIPHGSLVPVGVFLTEQEAAQSGCQVIVPLPLGRLAKYPPYTVWPPPAYTRTAP